MTAQTVTELWAMNWQIRGSVITLSIVVALAHGAVNPQRSVMGARHLFGHPTVPASKPKLGQKCTRRTAEAQRVPWEAGGSFTAAVFHAWPCLVGLSVCLPLPRGNISPVPCASAVPLPFLMLCLGALTHHTWPRAPCNPYKGCPCPPRAHSPQG